MKKLFMTLLLLFPGNKYNYFKELSLKERFYISPTRQEEIKSFIHDNKILFDFVSQNVSSHFVTHGKNDIDYIPEFKFKDKEVSIVLYTLNGSFFINIQYQPFSKNEKFIYQYTNRVDFSCKYDNSEYGIAYLEKAGDSYFKYDYSTKLFVVSEYIGTVDINYETFKLDLIEQFMETPSDCLSSGFGSYISLDMHERDFENNLQILKEYFDYSLVLKDYFVLARKGY